MIDSCPPFSSAPTVPAGAFRPRVLVFACRWCAALGADEAGRLRLDLPSGFRLIRVECAARVDTDTVLKAFSIGFDGVAVLGCHLDGCRYNRANHATAKRMALLATLLEATGIGADRLWTGFGTTHEGEAFANRIHRFGQQLHALGPVGGPSAEQEPGAMTSEGRPG